LVRRDQPGGGQIAACGEQPVWLTQRAIDGREGIGRIAF
jgi:hypothetical protein